MLLTQIRHELSIQAGLCARHGLEPSFPHPTPAPRPMKIYRCTCARALRKQVDSELVFARGKYPCERRLGAFQLRIGVTPTNAATTKIRQPVPGVGNQPKVPPTPERTNAPLHNATREIQRRVATYCIAIWQCVNWLTDMNVNWNMSAYFSWPEMNDQSVVNTYVEPRLRSRR